MLLRVLTSLLVAAIASASTGAGAETRVGAFDLPERASVGVEVSLTLELHRGCAPTYDDLASDSLLAAREGSAVGGKITGYTRHGLNQAISREGVGVSPRAILDTVRNPSQVIQRSGGITEYVGEAARVRLNEAGKVVTVFPRSSAGFRRVP